MGKLLRLIAWIILFVVGFWSLFHSINYLLDWFGNFWAILSLIVFPVVIAIVPIIALIRDGIWTLFVVTYGAGLCCTFLFNYSEAILETKPRLFKHKSSNNDVTETEIHEDQLWQRKILKNKPDNFLLIIRDKKEENRKQ